MDVETRVKFITLIAPPSQSGFLARLAKSRGRRRSGRRVFVAMAVAGLSLAAARSTPATADTAMQLYEFDIKRCSIEMPLPDGTTACDLQPFFVECLDEYVVGEYHVVGNHQEFATPSGTAHVRDNWKIVSMLFGVSSDREWYAIGVSPASANVGGADTFSSTGNLTYKPLVAGPTWQEQFVSKSIQNVNGEVVVEFQKDRAKCLGAGQ